MASDLQPKEFVGFMVSVYEWSSYISFSYFGNKKTLMNPTTALSNFCICTN